MHVAITRIDDTLPLPQYESAGAVGFDLITRETTTVKPGFARNYLLPRKKALVCPHSLGVIDQDYHGPEDELMVQVQNISDEPVVVERGERIAQGLFVKVEQAQWHEVDDHGAETRGGFGSTG